MLLCVIGRKISVAHPQFPYVKVDAQHLSDATVTRIDGLIVLAPEEEQVWILLCLIF
jgi:hypothetical protein